MTDGVLRLGDEPDAVSHGRRFVVTYLRDHGLDNLVDDASLVATELMTNGVLHAGPPVTVTVRVSARRHVARIEVEDTSSVSPLQGLPATDAMTGWGIGLVSALSQEWGVEKVDGGKVVWCELAAKPDPPWSCW